MNEPFALESANGVQQAVSCLALAQADAGESVAVFSWNGGLHPVGQAAVSPPANAVSARPGLRTSLRQWIYSCYLEPGRTEGLFAWAPDIVHLHSVHVPRNVALGSYLLQARTPYCVTVHGGLFGAALQRSRLRKAMFSALVERRFLNDAEFIHAVSPHETEAIRRYGVERPVVVVPNALPPGANMQAGRPDALYVEKPWLRDRRVFMFIGRLDPWQKGLDLLVEAFARANLSDSALVLVGPEGSGSRRTLEALADRQGILPQVVFCGTAIGEDRANLLAAADVFVHVSRWEGLSLAVLTAAAAGKPCVLTRAADPLGALERAQAALIVEATASSIADGLRQAAALTCDDLQKMGMRARQVVEQHVSWPRTARCLIDAYRAALERTASSR